MADTFAVLISALAVLLPTAVYCVAFYWADRYEREPRSLLLIAFIWGAIPSVVLSLISEVMLGAPLSTEVNSEQAAVVVGVIIAPIVEELAKGAALLGLFVWKREEFDGVLDGLIYGALVGFGFAMTENFLYFIGAYESGGFADLTALIFVRAILFGLNHAMYTSLTGIGFGMARNEPRTVLRIFWIGLGLGCAIAVHAAHNFGVLAAGVAPLGFLLSLAIAAGGAGLVVLAVVLSWDHERAVMRAELAEELGGLLSSQELMELTGRWRQPMRTRPNDGAAVRMSLYVELAMHKRRLRRLGPDRAAGTLREIDAIREHLERLNQGPAQVTGPAPTRDQV